MAAKFKVQPVTPVALPPLVQMAEHLRAALPGFQDLAAPAAQPTPSDLALDLAHLAHHDGDGFLIASRDEDVIGFAVSFVRSRQLLLSHLWLVPDLADGAVAELLVRRVAAFGARSGIHDLACHALAGPWQQAICFRFGMRPRFPVYRVVLSQKAALEAGIQLSRLLPGTELSDDEVTRRAGTGEPDRIDRLVRGVGRTLDHEYWLGPRSLRLATVREGNRVAAYAYGGHGQCGPVAATTAEAALAAVGWALRLAAASSEPLVTVYVPAVFEAGLEALLDAGGECRAQTMWLSQSPPSGMERSILGGPTLC